MTVVLHEITHGLNFSGTMAYLGGAGYWGVDGYPDVYDIFMRDGSGNSLINYFSGSPALGSVLVSNNVWFHGSQAMAANGNQRVKIYAPSSWSSGSSYGHLDYSTFNNTSNQLMVYALSNGESVHSPGTVTIALLKDLGWPTPLKVITNAVSNIYIRTATGNGSITSLGNSNPIQHGFCWNTTGNPTIANSRTLQGSVSTTGTFSSSLTNLSAATTYYVRAYVTNDVGTAYGGQVSFTTKPSIAPVYLLLKQ